MLVVVEHVEGSAGGREEHHVPDPGGLSRGRHRVLHGARVLARHPRRLERGADLIAVRADEHRALHAAAGCLGEGAKVLPLALAARDEDDGLGEALEGLDGRGDISALGVVVVADPALVEDPLDPVRDGAEGRDAAPDALGAQARPQRAGGGGEDVLDVVLAAQRDVRERADLLDVAVQLGHDGAAPHEDAVIEGAQPAEPEDARAGARGEGRRDGIVGVEHRAVRLGLVGEDPRLGLDVALDRSVPVEVIGGDVEHDGHPRPQELDRLELKARRLRHDEAVGGEVQGVGGERGADIAAHEDGPHRSAHELAREGGRGRLAVGARDGDEIGFHDAPAELELADDGHAARAGGLEHGQLEGHPRTDDDQLGAFEGGVRMAVHPEATAELLELLRLAGKRFETARVGRQDAAAEPADQPGCGHPASRQAHHGHGALGQPLPVALAPLPRHVILIRRLGRERDHRPTSA